MYGSIINVELGYLSTEQEYESMWILWKVNFVVGGYMRLLLIEPLLSHIAIFYTRFDYLQAKASLFPWCVHSQC